MAQRRPQAEDSGRVKRQKMEDPADSNSWLPGNDEVDGGVRLDGFGATKPEATIKHGS